MSTVLLVEDHDEVRAVHRRSLTEHGAYVLEARTAAEGIAIFKRNAGMIAGIVTDLRLVDETDENDVSGVTVAREAKKREPGMPIVCVSAFDYSGRFSDQPFDLYYRKGAVDPALSLLENIPAVLARFELYSQNKYSDMPAELLRLRDFYKMSDGDFLKLISALPISTRIQIPLIRVHDYANGIGTSADASAQHSVLFVEPGSVVGQEYGIRSIVPVVSKHLVGGEHVAELYGIPTVYAYGPTEDAAVAGLLESLSFYRQELKDDSGSTPDEQILRFKRFLMDIFDAA